MPPENTVAPDFTRVHLYRRSLQGYPTVSTIKKGNRQRDGLRNLLNNEIRKVPNATMVTTRSLKDDPLWEATLRLWGVSYPFPESPSFYSGSLAMDARLLCVSVLSRVCLIPWNCLTDGCEPPCQWEEESLGPLEEQSVDCCLLCTSSALPFSF